MISVSRRCEVEALPVIGYPQNEVAGPVHKADRNKRSSGMFKDILQRFLEYSEYDQFLLVVKRVSLSVH